MSIEKQKSVFETLSAVNVNGFTEKKNGLTYLSWAHAWGETLKLYPDATYYVQHNPTTNQMFWYDENLGYMVQTVVSIQGQSIPMQLPVLDGANKAMKATSYTYKGTAWVSGQKTTVDKTVEAATMFDINTAIMRCLTKNLALFGLGHYIYAGEDLPLVKEEVAETKPEEKAKPKATTAKTAPKEEKIDDRKTAALTAFKAIDFSKVISVLVKDYKLTYTKLEDFIAGETIERILEVYAKVK